MPAFSLLLVLFLFAMMGGVVQSITGFGAGIVMMIYLTQILPVYLASAVSSIVTTMLVISMVITYYKYLDKKHMLIPLPFYMCCSLLGITLSAGRDLSIMKVFFGIFLIAVAIYFVAFQGKIRVGGGWKSAAVCGGLSGTASGFFGIGGPPMAIYYMAVDGTDKNVYLGTMQTFFMITGLYNVGVRISKGIITLDLLPYAAAGLVGILTGKFLGTLCVKKMSIDTMKKLVYAFTAVAGLINIIQNI